MIFYIIIILLINKSIFINLTHYLTLNYLIKIHLLITNLINLINKISLVNLINHQNHQI